MLLVIDYGSGNLRSVSKACELLGANVVVSSEYKDIERADKIILPGVGAFRDAVEALNRFQLIAPLKAALLDAKKPYLGICLGMQLLFAESEEAKGVNGFNIFEGSVKRFKSSDLKVPHMGWNTINRCSDSPLFKNLKDEAFFYFCHSYYCAPDKEAVISSKTDYVTDFTSSIWSDNIFGVQFHPEKSQKLGLTVLKNFIEL